MANIAMRLERFFLFRTILIGFAPAVCPNYDSFYWNEPHTRALGKELFGF
jgi:hypothetical protein